MRSRHCRVCGGWHDLAQPWPFECIDHWGGKGGRSSAVPLPMLNRDQIDPLWCPIDNRMHESKSEIRALAKAHNLIEVGNEQQRDERRNDPVTAADVGEAMQKVNQGYRPSVHGTASAGWSDGPAV